MGTATQKNRGLARPGRASSPVMAALVATLTMVVLVAPADARPRPGGATAPATHLRPATAVDTDARWTIAPNAARTDGGAYINAVTCVTDSDCWAVGTATSGPLALHWNGGNWSSAGIAPVSTAGGQLNGVTCVSSTDCWAVGTSNIAAGPSSGTTQSLIEHWDGHGWTASPGLGSPLYNALTGVSCVDATHCLAVGWISGTPAETSYTVVWDGHVWTPIGASDEASGYGALLSVSCVTASDCWAVGYSALPVHSDIVELWNGTSWTSSPAPDGGSSFGSLNSVACVTSTDCWAVGITQQTSLVAQWNGISWQQIISAYPGPYGDLSGVSCLDATDCWAVGINGDTNGTDTATWTEHWDGADWTAVASSDSGGADTNNLSAVTCAANSDCWAVGGIGYSTGGGLVEHWDGVAGTQPYHPLVPYRITDTRPGSGQANAGHTLGPGGVLDVVVAGTGSGNDAVPAGATAAVLNVTAVDPSTLSYLSVYPAGQSPPLASNLNVTAGQVVPNLVQVPLGAAGGVDVYNNTGTVDVVVDVEGYVGPAIPVDSTAGQFEPMAPARLADTRPGSGEPDAGDTLGPGATLDVSAAGAVGIPSSGVSAVVVNVTAVHPSASTYLTAFPAGQSPPLASNLNVPAGQIVANRVIVPVGADGKIALYNAFGHIDVVVDVTGWYTDDAGPDGLFYTATSPTRLCDTRSVQPGVGANQCNDDGTHPGTVWNGSTLNVAVAGEAGVPVDAIAVVVNVTVTNTSAASFLTVWPGDTTPPLASDLNWTAGRTLPNLVVVAVGDDGTINVRNAFGGADVVIDVEGYYD
jgi:hypothetical protein